MGSLRVAVLGTAEIVVDGVRQEVSAAKHRALLAVLALHAGRRVCVDTIVDALWDAAPPPGALGTLQGYVADVRRLLEPARAPREAARVLVTVSGGYALRLPTADLDLTNFEEQVRRAARALHDADPTAPAGGSPPSGRELTEILDALDAALADWRGEPLADLAPAADVVAERDRLHGLLLDARMLRATAALGLGKHAEVVADLDGLARANPWNERLWGLRAVALAGSGRQAQALSCLRELTASLRDELGIEPTSDIRELETAILRQEIAPAASARSAPRPAAGAAAGAAAGPPSHRSADPWPLVGRDGELARLRRAVDLTAQGRTHAVHLTGEHGTGKSRMARELEAIARERGFQVARVRCRRDTRDVPLWAWRRLVGDLPWGPDSTELLPWDAASRLLDALADGGPLLVVVDDAHWADDATVQVLDHLLAEDRPAPLLVALGQRLRTVAPSAPMSSLLATLASRHAEHLALDGLDSESAARLLGAVCGARPHPRVTERVCERTDGNPFLLIEVARGGDFTADVLPGPARAVLDHHLSRIPAQTLELLAPASLLSRTWDADHLAVAARLDVDEVLARMSSAVAAGVLVEETHDRYRFTHQAVREHLARRLSQHARSRWHAAFATVLQERTRLDRPDRRRDMDRHWRHAGYRFADRAWRAQLAAARMALADEEHEEAAVLLDHALDSLRLDHDATADDHRTVLELRATLDVAGCPAESASDPVRSA